jgi:hypothetical protein
MGDFEIGVAEQAEAAPRPIAREVTPTAEVAAIGCTAEGIKRITKRANARLSADLAELVLGCEVSVDRVNNAMETRKRNWRMTNNSLK